MKTEGTKVAAIIGLAFIGIVTFWTVIVPILVIAAIMDIVNEN
jgi:hypothetical protein